MDYEYLYEGLIEVFLKSVSDGGELLFIVGDDLAEEHRYVIVAMGLIVDEQRPQLLEDGEAVGVVLNGYGFFHSANN